MIRVEKSSELLWFFGIIFVALGAAICSKADLGVSMIAAPAFVVSEALLAHCSILTVGDMITAFGVACFFRTYMPLQVYELFVYEVTEKYHLKISKTKWIFDLSLLIISVTLALTLFDDANSFNCSTIGYASFHSIGLGTLVTTAINSPLISLMGKLIDSLFDHSPRFTKLESFIKVK